MQPSNLYQDMISQISKFQGGINNLIAKNNQSTAFFGTPLVPQATINALVAANATLLANQVTLQNTIPTIVPGG